MAVPLRAWWATYDRTALVADAAAGLTLAAYLLPAAIGDASLAGLPPEAGLYACLFGSLVFWLLCSSRHTAITVTSAISLLVGASLGAISGGDPSRHGAELLIDLRGRFHRQGIDFGLAEAHGTVRGALRRLDRASAAELAEANRTVDDVLSKWCSSAAPA